MLIVAISIQITSINYIHEKTKNRIIIFNTVKPVYKNVKTIFSIRL